ncbi:hypothetical protein RclHR1_01430024 [Rhizophagus clarus]|nr:hypothetical protein RclHR1_01430024 [Rhizophagus clarus]
MNKESNLCMNGKDVNEPLGQTDCGSAMKWDLFGRKSPDYNMIKDDSNNIQISKGGLARVVLGSIISTSLIAFAICYSIIKHKKIYPNHALNV